jgi:N-acetylneuraminate synthase
VKIVAEIGLNSNADLKLAFALIKMAKDCGADYVKFQKRDIDTCYTKEFLDSPRESPWGKTQRDQKQGLEFGIDEYRQIDHYCKGLGIGWFASCWDLKSLDQMREFKPEIYKIASPMLTNNEFVAKVASLGHRTLISTGMTEWEAIDSAVEIFKFYKTPFVLLHCVSEYPCPDTAINLLVLDELRARYKCPVGYSNHSPGIEACIGAAYMGATWLEVHITLDRSSYGSDQAASLEHRGLELVCKYARNAKTIIGDGVKIITAMERANASKMRYWK